MKAKSKIQLVLWTLLFMVAIPLSAYGVDGQIKIAQPASFPIVIDLPGSYVLTSNIIVPAGVNGIWIKTNNTTLDLNGHAIIGPGSGSSSGSGIHASVKFNIAIINGTVRDFALNGVHLDICFNSQVRDMRVYKNGSYGIVAVYSIIANCTAFENAIGIEAFGSVIANCTTADNGTGISAFSSTVTNCTTSRNSDGISAWDSTITNCTASFNANHGVHAREKNRIEGNNLRGNGGYGLYLEGSHNYAIKNSASDNAIGNFAAAADNYMPTSLTAPDAANANIGW